MSDKSGDRVRKAKTAAWTRKEGKNPEGGLNAKGRASYNKKHGANLKAPQPEGGSRKKFLRSDERHEEETDLKEDC